MSVTEQREAMFANGKPGEASANASSETPGQPSANADGTTLGEPPANTGSSEAPASAGNLENVDVSLMTQLVGIIAEAFGYTMAV